ncbi:MAG: hypothetical protein AAB545_03430 [Patescibacteria group bacterium]
MPRVSFLAGGSSFFLFFFFFALLLPRLSFAAPGDITLFLNPTHPAPKEPYTVFIQGLSDSSKITWVVDGKAVSSGYEKSLPQTAGEAGERSVISAQLESGIEILEKSIVVIPAGITLITKVESVVPPFYRGKALATPEGKVTIIALPQMTDSSGRKIDSSKIVFTWKEGGLVMQGVSGVGKNTYPLISDALPGNSTEISVTGASLSGGMVAEAKIFLAPVVPKLFLYERTPLSGTVFERTINKGLNLLGDETEIVAYPYFMSPQGFLGNDGKLSWQINGRTLEKEEYSGNSLRVRRPSTNGQSLIHFSVQDMKRVFSEAKESLLIHY